MTQFHSKKYFAICSEQKKLIKKTMKDKIVQFFKPKNELDNLVKELKKLKKDKTLSFAVSLCMVLNSRKIYNMSEEEWDKYEKETGNPRLDKVIKNEEELEIATHKFVIYRVLKIEKEIKNSNNLELRK